MAPIACGPCARQHHGLLQCACTPSHPTTGLFPQDDEAVEKGSDSDVLDRSSTTSRMKRSASKEDILRFAGDGYVLAGVVRTSEAGTALSKPSSEGSGGE